MVISVHKPSRANFIMKDSIWPGAPSAATFMLFYWVKAVHLTSATAKITAAGQRVISKVNLWFYPFELRGAAGHGEPRRRCSGTSSVAFVWVIFACFFFSLFARGFFYSAADFIFFLRRLFIARASRSGLWWAATERQFVRRKEGWRHPRTHACDKGANALLCLLFGRLGLLIRSITRDGIMTFTRGQSCVSWVTRPAICYYIR